MDGVCPQSAADFVEDSLDADSSHTKLNLGGLADSCLTKSVDEAALGIADDVTQSVRDENTEESKEAGDEDDGGREGGADEENEKNEDNEKNEGKAATKKIGKKTKEELLEFCAAKVAYLKEQTSWGSEETLKVLKSLGRVYWNYRKWRKSVGSLFVELKFAELAVRMLKYFNEEGIFKSDNIWFPTYFTYQVVWNFTDSSLDLAKELSDEGLLELIVLNIGHPPYLENEQSKNVAYILKASLSILQNLVKVPENKEKFEELKVKELLQPFLTSKVEFFKAVSTMVLTAIINEEENKLLEDTGAIDFMLKGIRIALKNSKGRRYRGFSPTELTECISRMAVNDSNKKKVVEVGALPLLVEMLKYEKNVEEQMAAARTIWVLSFDKEVAQNIKDEPEMMETLEALSKSEHAKLKKFASGALWVLKGEASHRESHAAKESEEAKENAKPHIFISYSWAEQERVVQIKDFLKSLGFRVWIDVEQMCGSTLEAMADGIEKASFVLICASEKYKISPNCRTEAEYTFQLKKPIIPLMLQRHYRPDGWLGIMMGAKLYINFDGKYTFDHACNMLVRELETMGKSSDEPIDVVDAVPVSSSIGATGARKSNNVLSWSLEQVKEWQTRNNLTDKRWTEIFKGFDGKRLSQLHKMSSVAPDFYYRYMSETMRLQLTEILDLSSALDNL